MVEISENVLSIRKYFQGVIDGLEVIDELEVQSIAEMISNVFNNNGKVFVFGNGGSAAVASHFACDLAKGTANDSNNHLPALSLTDNNALITAISNDIGFESVFKEQLSYFLDSKDAVIGISASGNSANVINAIRYAKLKGVFTIGLYGFGGGILGKITDKAIIINNNNYGQVEDIHLSLTHIIALQARKLVFKKTHDL